MEVMSLVTSWRQCFFFSKNISKIATNFVLRHELWIRSKYEIRMTVTRKHQCNVNVTIMSSSRHHVKMVQKAKDANIRKIWFIQIFSCGCSNNCKSEIHAFIITSLSDEDPTKIIITSNYFRMNFKKSLHFNFITILFSIETDLMVLILRFYRIFLWLSAKFVSEHTQSVN